MKARDLITSVVFVFLGTLFFIFAKQIGVDSMKRGARLTRRSPRPGGDTFGVVLVRIMATLFIAIGLWSLLHLN